MSIFVQFVFKTLSSVTGYDLLHGACVSGRSINTGMFKMVKNAMANGFLSKRKSGLYQNE